MTSRPASVPPSLPPLDLDLERRGSRQAQEQEQPAATATGSSRLSGRTGGSARQPQAQSPVQIQQQQQQQQQQPQPHQQRRLKQPPYRFLTPDEWARVALGLGAIDRRQLLLQQRSLSDEESHTPFPHHHHHPATIIHPTSLLFPPWGLPPGLYREVVGARARFRATYRALGALHWALMVLQIVLGAVLTALGSVGTSTSSSSSSSSSSSEDEKGGLRDGIPITVLAANQTVIAGLLALLHNSGLPERHRACACEFERVEDHLRELLDTGIVPRGRSVDEVIAGCWDRFAAAKAAVEANAPGNYIPSATLDMSRLPGGDRRAATTGGTGAAGKTAVGGGGSSSSSSPPPLGSAEHAEV